MADCPNCGFAATPQDMVCPNCAYPLRAVPPPSPPAEPTDAGRHQEATAESEVAASLSVSPAPAPRSRLPLMVGVGLAVIAVVAVAAWLLLVPRTPRERFLAAQYWFWKDTAASFREANALQIELAQRQTRDPARSVVQLTGDLSGLPELTPFRDIIRESALTLETRTDPPTGRQSIRMGYELRGSQLIDAEMYQDPDRMALSVPVLYDRYVVLENENLGAFLRRQGIPYQGPDRILTNRDYAEALHLPPEQWREIQRRYGTYLRDHLDEEDFTLTRDVKYESPEGTVLLRQVTLTLSEQKCKDLARGLVTEFRNDTATVDLLVENTANWMQLMADSGSPVPGELTDPNYLRDQIASGADDVLDAIDGWRIPGGIKFALLLDKKGRIVQQKLEVGVDAAEGQAAFQATHDTWRSADKATETRINLTVGPRENGGTDALVYMASIQTKPKGKGITDVSAAHGLMAPGLMVDLKYNGDVVREPKGTYEAKVDFDAGLFAGPAEAFEVAGTFSQRIDAATQAGVYKTRTDVDMRVSDSITVRVTAGGTTDFSQPLAFPEFTAANAFMLNEASPAEIEAVLWEIQQAAGDFFMRNADLFQ